MGRKHIIVHDPLNATVNHFLPHADVDWTFSPLLNEKDLGGPGGGDELTLSGSLEHMLAPHAGEDAPNGNILNLRNAPLEVGALPLPTNAGPFAGTFVSHKDHFDSWNGGYKFTVAANGLDADQYVIIYQGAHTKDKPKAGVGAIKKTSGSVPLAQTVEYPLSTVIWLGDPIDMTFSFALYLDGISVSEISSAVIRDGTEASPGPIIYDLVPSLFETEASTGVVRSIDDAFPSAYWADLVAGNTFVELLSPAATYTAQLTPNPIMPQVVGVEPPRTAEGIEFRRLRFVAGTGVMARVTLNGTPARIDLYDVAGKRMGVREFAEGQSGSYEVTFPGSAGLPQGVYFARLRSGALALACRVAVVR